MKLLISPHNDDEVLFTSFTILREMPLVVIVYDGYIQGKRGLNVTADRRRKETLAAMKILGANVEFLGFPDDNPLISSVAINHALQKYGSKLETIYYPAFEFNGHVQHNLVSQAGLQGLGGSEIHVQYMTYTTQGKSRSDHLVSVEHSSWISKKLRALACYESQFSLDPHMGCWQHFLRDQNEYTA